MGYESFLTYQANTIAADAQAPMSPGREQLQ